MPGRLVEADIVICSTGAPHTVLHAETVIQAMELRAGRPLLIADLAVPRDADPQIGEIPGVQLVDIDELDDLVQARHPLAAATRQRAEEIVCEELECLQAWLEGRQNAALICELQERVNSIVTDQVQITARKLGGLTPEEQYALEIMGKAIASHILHEPIRRLKQNQEDSQSEDLEALAIKLFGLN
jgi:glutamyl-tRNA reductase